MTISSKSSPEEVREFRQQNEPSNMDVIGAFAQSDHLQLFCVGNLNKDRLYVLASSWRNAEIIAMMGGHIRSLKNGQRWKPMLSTERGSAVAKAIRDGVPGAVWVHEGGVIMLHNVYNDES